MNTVQRNPASRIEDRLKASALRDPDGVAFVCRDQSISFRDLAERADRFAGSINARGVEAGARIGILMFKSIDMPAAVYGVLCAGCTYVPLDPLTAPWRLERIIEDCGIDVLVCDAMCLRRAKAVAAERDLLIVGDESVCNDCETLGIRAVSWKDIDGAETAHTPNAQTELAYIIYTSGSTGLPKGIAHTHTSALGYVDACLDTWDFSHSDRFANHSPLHFDMATMEFLVAPSVGACAVLVTEDLMKLPASMAELIERERISIWYSVPIALIQLLDSGALAARDLSALRHIIFAGEAFAVARLRELHAAHPSCDYSNAYGPTETNVCTVARIDPSVLKRMKAVPIGAAWLGTKTRIENDSGQLVDQGETGELLVSGATLMAGYWKRPDLDGQVFAERNGERYYRTGDLAHGDDDGVLYLHGRIDRQIKHRGFRIELDEIENVLHDHDDVAVAAAILDEKTDELVAVVALHTGADEIESTRSVRRHLKARLQAYAVPQRLHVIDALPLGANNKLDRQTLSRQIGSLNTQDEGVSP